VPRIVKPLEPPKIVQPSDVVDGEPEFRLDDSELFIRDLWAQEPIQISGTDCNFFHRNKLKSKFDPLYREPISVVFDGPFRLRVHIEWPEATPDLREEGLRLLFPSGAWIPRKSLEDVSAPAPDEGDILHFWDLPFFDKLAVHGIETPTGGYFFDLIKVNDAGHVHDTPAFVAFQCDLKRRSSAPAELNLNILKTKDDHC